MTLTTAQVALLDNFSKTQPALNLPGVPSAESGIALGTEIAAGGGGASISDTAYGAGWNGVTTVAPSKNAVYDKMEAVVAAVPVVGYGTTNASGEILVTSMTATGKVVVTPIEDPGSDLVFSHVVCGVGKITIYVKDASGTTPIAAAAAGAGFDYAYVIVALS